MLAAGTGLAPMVPILHSITDNADDETFVTLVGCFKTFEGIYLKPFLQEQARFWNIRTFFVLSQVSPGCRLASLIETPRSLHLS